MNNISTTQLFSGNRKYGQFFTMGVLFWENAELLDEYNHYFNFSGNDKWEYDIALEIYAHMASMDIIPAPMKSARYVIS